VPDLNLHFGEGEDTTPGIQYVLGKGTPTDTGNAYRFARLCGSVVRYVPEEDVWLVWDGNRLKRDDANIVLDMTISVCTDVIKHIITVPEDDRRRWRDWARVTESAARRKAMLELARSLPALIVHTAELDANPLLINYPNGTYDGVERRMREHRMGDYITRMCPTAYDPVAEDAIWQKVLNELFDDGDPYKELKLKHLQLFAGYTLLGLTNEKKVLAPFGPRDTAKSTVTEAIYSALGDVTDGGYATTWDAEVIQANSRINRAEKIHKSHGARMIIVGELEKGSRMADGFLKRFSGGDTVDARPMYKPSYSTRPQAKVWMPTNYIPKSSDPAMQGRLDLLPFRHVPEKIDRSIIDYLQRSMSAHQAVLAWAMRGLIEYLEARDIGVQYPLGETPWLDALIEDYARDSNPLLDFTAACFDFSDEEEMHSSHVDFVWATYVTWAQDNVGRPLKRRTFERALVESGYVKRRIPAKAGPMCWFGLQVKPSSELPSGIIEILRLRWPGCCP